MLEREAPLAWSREASAPWPLVTPPQVWTLWRGQQPEVSTRSEGRHCPACSPSSCMGLVPARSICCSGATWWAEAQVGGLGAGGPGLGAGSGGPGHCRHHWTSSQAHTGAGYQVARGCQATDGDKAKVGARARANNWVVGGFQVAGRGGARGWVGDSMKVSTRARMVSNTHQSSSVFSTA